MALGEGTRGGWGEAKELAGATVRTSKDSGVTSDQKWVNKQEQKHQSCSAWRRKESERSEGLPYNITLTILGLLYGRGIRFIRVVLEDSRRANECM